MQAAAAAPAAGIPGERALSPLRRLVPVRRLRLQLRRPADPHDADRADQERIRAARLAARRCSAALAFALFYTTFGIPIARWADKSNRVNIIALSLARLERRHGGDGVRAQLLAAVRRAHRASASAKRAAARRRYSLISDYFEPKRRATALSIYSMGVYGGSFIGLLMGGVVAQRLRLARRVLHRRPARHRAGADPEADDARTAARLLGRRRAHGEGSHRR